MTNGFNIKFPYSIHAAERSLRNIVMENRKQMKSAITDEEKGLQILAQGQ